MMGLTKKSLTQPVVNSEQWNWNRVKAWLYIYI